MPLPQTAATQVHTGQDTEHLEPVTVRAPEGSRQNGPAAEERARNARHTTSPQAPHHPSSARLFKVKTRKTSTITRARHWNVNDMLHCALQTLSWGKSTTGTRTGNWKINVLLHNTQCGALSERKTLKSTTRTTTMRNWIVDDLRAPCATGTRNADVLLHNALSGNVPTATMTRNWNVNDLHHIPLLEEGMVQHPRHFDQLFRHLRFTENRPRSTR